MEGDESRMNTSIAIRQIRQKDNQTFSIVWSDQKEQDFHLRDLQKNCPCANCVDEMTGQRLLNPDSVKENVRAVAIRNVGRYGLQIQFTSGCSMGIYSFEMLRQMRVS